MNIVIFSAYPPAKDGIADYTKRLVDSLEQSGQDAIIIAPQSMEHTSSTQVHRVLSLSLSSIKNTLKILKDFQPDVIHVQYCLSLYGLSSFAIYFILKIYKHKNPKTTTIITLHELQREQDRIGFLAKSFYYFFLKIYDGFMTHTRASEKILQTTYRISPVRIQQINFPIYEFQDTALTAASADKRLSLGDKFVILCFGFIQVDKGIQYLLQALTEPVLKKHLNQISLIIAGDVRPRSGIFKYFGKKDKEYKNQLHDFVQRNGLENNVTFTGFVAKSEVYSLFDRTNLIVIPYTKIEHSSVLGMSLTAGKPIIASDVGGLGETLQQTGILVKPASSSEIAESIANIMANPAYSRDLIASYASINDGSTQEIITERTVSFYRELAKQ